MGKVSSKKRSTIYASARNALHGRKISTKGVKLMKSRTKSNARARKIDRENDY